MKCALRILPILLMLLTSAFAAPSTDSLFSAQGYTIVRGDLDGSLPQGVYYFPASCIVPRNKRLIVETGSRLVFADTAGIRIEGTLELRGTNRGVVTLDRVAAQGNMQPKGGRRWKGITVADSGSLLLRYSVISGAQCGVDMHGDAATLTCDMASFRDNGAHIRIVGREVPVREREFFSLTLSGADRMSLWSTVVEAKKSGGPTAAHKVPTPRPVRITRIAGAGFVLCGAALWAGGNIAAARYYDDYRDARSTAEASEAKKMNRRYLLVRNVGAAVCGAGVFAVAVGFVF